MNAYDIEKIEADVKSSLLQSVRREYPDVSSKDIIIDVQNLERLDKIKTDTTVKYEISINPRAKVIGTTILPLVLKNKDDEEVTRLPLIVNLDVFGRIVKSKRIIRRGERFATRDIVLKYNSIQYEPPTRLRRLSDVVGKEATVTLAQNTTITERMVREAPLVRRGQKVDILMTEPGIRLKIKGLALEDGKRDDIIRVKTALRDSKIIKGRVTNEGMVQLYSTY